MHVRLLSRWLSDRKVIGHAARADALTRAVGALLKGGRLSLSGIGRSMPGSAYVKHHIKAVDRLLANRHLYRERNGIFRAIGRTLLAGNKSPVIVVDWSDFEHGRKCVMLKAAVPVGGRAITLYERVFPMKRYNSPSAHREFLATLRSILPSRCRPIIITDAGFRGPWFREVESHGWDWIGRLRNGLNYYSEKSGAWHSIASLCQKATSTTRFIGDVSLGKMRQSYRARLYLVRANQRPAGQKRPKSRQRNPKKHRRRHGDPWLLATSLPHQPGTCKRTPKANERFSQPSSSGDTSWRAQRSSSLTHSIRARSAS